MLSQFVAESLIFWLESKINPNPSRPLKGQSILLGEGAAAAGLLPMAGDICPWKLKGCWGSEQENVPSWSIIVSLPTGQGISTLYFSFSDPLSCPLPDLSPNFLAVLGPLCSSMQKEWNYPRTPFCGLRVGDSSPIHGLFLKKPNKNLKIQHSKQQQKKNTTK